MLYCVVGLFYVDLREPRRVGESDGKQEDVLSSPVSPAGFVDCGNDLHVRRHIADSGPIE